MSSFLKHFLFISALMLTMSIQAQHHSFVTPRIWLAADSVGNNNYWQDISGNGYHAYSPGGAFVADSGLFNYQPCLIFDSLTESLVIDYVAKGSSPILVFAVYRPTGSSAEKGIWSVRLDSALQISVTTMRLGNFYGKTTYMDSTECAPVLNLLNMYWKNREIDSLQSRITFAGTDSLPFEGKMAEFMFYDTLLKHNEIEKIHTYLALKYGINVREMDYVNSVDTVLWDYSTDSAFSNGIAGIGKDSLMQVDQRQSCGQGGEASLSIAAGTHQPTNAANNAVMAEMDYLIWGNNNMELPDMRPDTLGSTFVAGLSACEWLMKRSGSTADEVSTQVVLSFPEYMGIGIVNLVINSETDFMFPASSSVVYTATSSDTLGNFYFNGIYWDTDGSGSDAFGFQLIDTLGVNDRMHVDPMADGHENSNEGAVFSSIDAYPNPTGGNYSIDIRLLRETGVEVIIQDENGKIVSKKELQGASIYRINGFLTDKGCYLIQAIAGEETKTVKLIVQ
ncbi:MAG: hypothetical protein CVU11_12940 [Bacteroidetes bacterium HGW-Bacteroidetes-6]|nr:MAG: hypothetical protein CVU11_12940 [Bacteroidetes bacterium HGW-Bacteroidetes-6]